MGQKNALKTSLYPNTMGLEKWEGSERECVSV